jgi:hypothetical protein
MDKFIYVISNGEFWIAIIVALMLSFVLATIVQDLYDTYIDICNEDIDYEVSDEKLNIGCTVKDCLNGIIGLYCGTDDNGKAIIINAQDNTVYVYKAEHTTLLTIKK